MIRDIGCGEDGSVWISLFIETKCEKCGQKETQIGIIPMENKKACIVRDSLTKAIEQGKQWKKTGIQPEVEKPDIELVQHDKTP